MEGLGPELDLTEDVYLSPPQFFGAQCIFKESVRTRNVIALIKTELVKVSTSAIYALSKDHPEVGQSLAQRLRDAAMFGELCAHCGFAHRIVDCPLLCQDVAKSQEFFYLCYSASNSGGRVFTTRRQSCRIDIKRYPDFPELYVKLSLRHDCSQIRP